MERAELLEGVKTLHDRLNAGKDREERRAVAAEAWTWLQAPLRDLDVGDVQVCLNLIGLLTDLVADGFPQALLPGPITLVLNYANAMLRLYEVLDERLIVPVGFEAPMTRTPRRIVAETPEQETRRRSRLDWARGQHALNVRRLDEDRARGDRP